MGLVCCVGKIRCENFWQENEIVICVTRVSMRMCRVYVWKIYFRCHLYLRCIYIEREKKKKKRGGGGGGSDCHRDTYEQQQRYAYVSQLCEFNHLSRSNSKLEFATLRFSSSQWPKADPSDVRKMLLKEG